MHGLFGLYLTWWEGPNDKSNDCGMIISDLIRYCWGELLDAFQVQDMFCHHGVQAICGIVGKWKMQEG